MFKDTYGKLKFKKLDKFYVQIWPIFARPVTNYDNIILYRHGAD